MRRSRCRGAPAAAPPRAGRHPWADLLRRVFGLDVLRCPSCGGWRRIVAAITQGAAIRAVLESLGLPAQAPAGALARGPPDLSYGEPPGAAARERGLGACLSDSPGHRDVVEHACRNMARRARGIVEPKAMRFGTVLDRSTQRIERQCHHRVLAGSLAMQAHGASRTTQGLDLIVDAAARGDLLAFMGSLGDATLQASAG